MPVSNPYPLAASHIKHSNKTYTKVNAATMAVNNSPAKIAIALMGGVPAVTAAILAAISPWNSTVNQAMAILLVQYQASCGAAIYAILVRLI